MTERPTGDDRGFSLMEVLVTTGIMSVVMVVVLTATIQVYSGTKQIEQKSVAADQVDISFGRLERELRYATYVSTPGLVGGSRWYMEFAIPPREKTAEDVTDPLPRCRQLQFDIASKTLKMAGWELPDTTRGAWAGLAADSILETNVAPFSVYRPGDQPYVSASADATGVGSEFSPKYLMTRIQFKIKQGGTVQTFDSVFTSQNITEDTDGDAPDGKDLADPDKQCRNVGRP